MKSYWGWSVGISMLVHTFFLVGLSFPPNKKNPSSKEKVKGVEMIFQKMDEEKQTERKEEKGIKEKSLSELKPPPYVENLVLKKIMLENKEFSSWNKPQVLERKGNKISSFEFPHPQELKRIPGYLDYYRLIREKIRSNAYRYYDGKSKGEIFLNFVVTEDGHLKNLYPDEESMSDKALTEIAIRSVKEAAPFPVFPQKLAKFKHLQFNISIYFKNN